MADRALTLRLKAKNGHHVVSQFTLDSTLGDLRSKISELTKIPNCALKLLLGFPPKPVDISDNSRKLSSLQLRSGETLIVEEDNKQRAAEQVQVAENVLKEVQNQWQASDGILTRHVVPANNSCLFTSVYFVMEGGKLDLSCASAMRELIAQVVASDPVQYNEAFLGKSNGDYCAWIMNDDTWGGAIELSVLSQFYQVEIDVVDTQTGRADRYGEDRNYLRRVLLIYDGIHYDPLMLEPTEPGRPPQTMFSSQADGVLVQALQLASEAKASRQFTDVSGFSLRCLICQKALVGQSEAQEHAKQTGHINFGEF